MTDFENNLLELENLLSAVNSLPSGSATVQTVTGNSTTNNSGILTINCGFRPDLVILHVARISDSGVYYESVATYAINARKYPNNTLCGICWDTDGTSVVDGDLSGITDTGVTIEMWRYGANGTEGAIANRSFSWTAIKYT